MSPVREEAWLERVSPWRPEARELMRLALPVIGAQLSSMGLGLADIAMVGRVSVEAMAALAMANVWIFALFMLAQGVLMGIDPIVAQAHGAGDGVRCGLALQRGLVVALCLCLPLGILFWVTEPALLALGQDAGLAAGAGAYTRIQIPSLPFLLGFVTLRHYLQGRASKA